MNKGHRERKEPALLVHLMTCRKSTAIAYTLKIRGLQGAAVLNFLKEGCLEEDTSKRNRKLEKQEFRFRPFGTKGARLRLQHRRRGQQYPTALNDLAGPGWFLFNPLDKRRLSARI